MAPISNAQHEFEDLSDETDMTGVELFLKNASRFFPFLKLDLPSVPFLHPMLRAAMCCLGYQYSGRTPDQRTHILQMDSLSLRYYNIALEHLARSEHQILSSTENLEIIQASLIVEVYAMLYADQEVEGTQALSIHSKVIRVSVHHTCVFA
jgi:hypothetical protein